MTIQFQLARAVRAVHLPAPEFLEKGFSANEVAEAILTDDRLTVEGKVHAVEECARLSPELKVAALARLLDEQRLYLDRDSLLARGLLAGPGGSSRTTFSLIHQSLPFAIDAEGQPVKDLIMSVDLRGGMLTAKSTGVNPGGRGGIGFFAQREVTAEGLKAVGFAQPDQVLRDLSSRIKGLIEAGYGIGRSAVSKAS